MDVHSKRPNSARPHALTFLKPLLCAALLLGAAPCVHPAHEPAEPATRPVARSSCEAACTNAARLGCEGWDGSPGSDERRGTGDDVPCPEVCRNLEGAAKELPGVSLHPECVRAAESCAAVSRCFD